MASRTIEWRRWKRGQPQPYVDGHEPTAEYAVNDRGCWVWQRLVSKNGYGRISSNGTDRRAHRIYYERKHGPLPEGMVLHHTCTNKLCVNPDHLQPLTATQHRRIAHHNKLGPTEVEQIRALAANTNLTQREIAVRFNIVPGTVSKILRGERWGQWTA